MKPSRASEGKNCRIQGYVQVASGAALISFSAVFVKLAHVGPATAGFYRMLFGGLILLLLLGLRREPIFRGHGLSPLVAVCGLLFSLDLTFWHRSIQAVGPGLSTLLANFQVFFLALAGVWLLGEKTTWQLALSLPLAMAGLYFLVGPDWGNFPEIYKRGVVFGLLAALCYAAYLLFLRKIRSESDRRSSYHTVAFVSLFSALFMGLEVWLGEEGFGIPDLQSWLSLVAYGIAGQVLGWVFISRGLPMVNASRAGLILLLQPTLAFLWDILLFQRPITPRETSGAILALVAIYLGTLGEKGPKE